MPKTIPLRSIVPRTPTSQAQARLYTAVLKRAFGWERALPKWYTIERVKPEEGELLGFLHEEQKRCGKDNCRCTSGREEDLHGPYYYRRWRDEDGNQWREYVPKEDVDEVRARIEKRRRRVEREREERAEWMNRGEGNGRPAHEWKAENRPTPAEKVDRLASAVDSLLP